VCEVVEAVRAACQAVTARALAAKSPTHSRDRTLSSRSIGSGGAGPSCRCSSTSSQPTSASAAATAALCSVWPELPACKSWTAPEAAPASVAAKSSCSSCSALRWVGPAWSHALCTASCAAPLHSAATLLSWTSASASTDPGARSCCSSAAYNSGKYKDHGQELCMYVCGTSRSQYLNKHTACAHRKLP
jgi:hypothetical protein